MRHGIVAAFAGGLLLMSPGMALAGHGKAGLWTVTSTTNMGLTLPPEVARQMKVTGAPGSRTTTSRMCMSQAEVDASAPPHIDQGATGCTTELVSATANSMSSRMVCNGNMKGTGTMKITYAGDTAYSGAYDFNGTLAGNATHMSTTFAGKWIKADCGSVKPYALRTQ